MKNLFLGLLLLLAGCKFYHNTTARFNAYFLANEKITEVEIALFGKYNDDFNNVLQVLHTLDSNTAKPHKTSLDYAIEKASIAIENHKTSDWTDDSYILIGKARLYLGDFRNALNTFKYVNSTSTDVNARHKALSFLMRSFIEKKDFKSAEGVAQYMAADPTPISPENSKDFYITLAHYYRLRNSYANVAKYLEKAIPYIKKRQERNRMMYICAQIYMRLNQNAKAYEYFSAVANANPDDNMLFYAQLNAAKTLDVSDKPEEAKKVARGLVAMLEDEKNAEFKDKIYYDLASFELKQNHVPEALDFLSESLFASQGNEAQRAYTYRLFGKIYEEKYQKYEKAATYYDSSAQLIKPNMDYFEEIKTKSKLMSKFAKYYLAVKKADKLLKLSAMDTADAKEILRQEMEGEKADLDKLEEAYKTRQSQKPAQAKSESKSKFYFYQNELVNFGKSYFFREWGNRPLEDHWRRADKQRVAQNVAVQVNENQEVKKEVKKDKYASVKTVAARLKEVPNTEDRKNVLLDSLQSSLLNLAKMYADDFKEYDNARKNLERLYQEFPKSRFRAEILYQLGKVCKLLLPCKSDSYDKELREKFAETMFAKLLDNKNFVQETNQHDATVEKIYEKCYDLYQKNDFVATQNLLDEALIKYPENKFLDKIKILKVMTVGKTQNLDIYKKHLEDFIKENPQSQMLDFAQKLLESAGKVN